MLTILSNIFSIVVRRRNAQFDSGKRPSVEVTVPVISVGNISVGGSGKTPMVQFIASELRDAGYRPGIVLRGYGRKGRGLCVVHNGEKIVSTVDQSGDEAMLHARELDVPVVVCEDRVEAAAVMAGTLPVDVIIADDAFQHRNLKRQFDVVLVRDSDYQDKLLPAGRLREPVSSLKRASVVINTDQQVEIETTWHKLSVNGWETATTQPHSKVFALSSIAKPERFAKLLEKQGIEIAATKYLRDHTRYNDALVNDIVLQAAKSDLAIATTTKDAVKLAPHFATLERANVSVLVASIQFRNSEFLRNVIEQIILAIKESRKNTDEDRDI